MRSILSIVTLASIALVSGGEVEARHVSGGMCQQEIDDGTFAQYGSNGVQNNSSTTRARVWCPLENTGTVTGTMRIFVRDRATSVGTNYQFSCTLHYRTPTGGYYSSSTLTSSDGYVTLSWTNPFSFGTPPAQAMLAAECLMPFSEGGLESTIIGLDI